MKYLKMLGLAVVAAAALSAFAGAGTAFATEGCKATENPCSSANMYTTGQEYHAVLTSGKKAVLSGSLEVSCSESTYKGKQENTGSSTETVNVAGEVLSFGNCGTPIVTVQKAPTLEVHTDKSEVDNGEVTAKGFEVTVSVFGLTCIYGGEVKTGLTIKGGTSPELIATKAPIKVIGGTGGAFLCGTEGTWSAEYEITTPKPLWVI